MKSQRRVVSDCCLPRVCVLAISNRCSEDSPHAHKGLVTNWPHHITEIHREWEAIVQGRDEVRKSTKTLENRWKLLSTQRQRERDEEEKQDLRAKVRFIAAKVLVGVIGCWVAQWVWWVGLHPAGWRLVNSLLPSDPNAFHEK